MTEGSKYLLRAYLMHVDRCRTCSEAAVRDNPRKLCAIGADAFAKLDDDLKAELFPQREMFS